jgi:hypothetical protein
VLLNREIRQAYNTRMPSDVSTNSSQNTDTEPYQQQQQQKMYQKYSVEQAKRRHERASTMLPQSNGRIMHIVFIFKILPVVYMNNEHRHMNSSRTSALNPLTSSTSSSHIQYSTSHPLIYDLQAELQRRESKIERLRRRLEDSRSDVDVLSEENLRREGVIEELRKRYTFIYII